MKAKYISLAAVAIAALASTSCAKHDIFDERGEIGARVPYAYWEVGSTTCKAGQDFTFLGKYYTQEKNVSPKNTEVWYSIIRDQSSAATVKLAGSLAYTQTVTDTRTMRELQSIISYDHNAPEVELVKNGNQNEFHINATVPTSATLAPVSWNTPAEWDQNNFEAYYPEGFAEEFCDKVIEYLTKDSAYYSSLRTVYANYNFTMEQFDAVNKKYNVSFPTDINPEDASNDKMSRWFQYTSEKPTKVIGYYYKDVNSLGQTVIVRVPLDYANNENRNLYEVYDAADWVFCRYDDDAGAVLSTVKAEYKDAFIDLLKNIAFTEWIYDSAEQNYAVSFSREYSLSAQFRVYDTAGHEGIASDTRVISLN